MPGNRVTNLPGNSSSFASKTLLLSIPLSLSSRYENPCSSPLCCLLCSQAHFCFFLKPTPFILQTLTGKEVTYLRHYRIETICNVHFSLILSTRPNLHVAFPNNLGCYFLIEIDIEKSDKISRIKERVEEKEGIPPPQQRADEKSAEEYNIEGGSVLHLVLALRGGAL
ncbi:hypothetical protein BC937DRAFT_91112 [Endogone sp. FLAS-F59071]|nr:hypothetical protein BC937DRAFT_91112 [Endogone sp. FLAS-F59071]|eukprot:RUS16528.1 hypothetical protein BC937DRAFT_91112 [Endogone sp. FLAS-F59071]